MLTLARLRTRGSPTRSFSDSARPHFPRARPANVRLNIARRTTSEVERFACGVVRCAAGARGDSLSRWRANGDDV